MKVLLKIAARNEAEDKTFLRSLFKRHLDIEIGAFSYGGCFSLSGVPSGTKIGKFCSFADEVMIIPTNHPLDLISTHPIFFKPSFGLVPSDSRSRIPIEIGHDVWIGHRATILPNVQRIGNGAVIAAGSVVTKDVPDYAVVAGVPAKIVRFRFDLEMQKIVNESQWWNWPMEMIKDRFELFSDPSAFAKAQKFCFEERNPL